MEQWTADPDALDLVERHGGPFELAAFRRAWLSAYPEHAEASWGGRLPDGTRAAVALVRVGRAAESLPLNYGGIVATRRLAARSIRGFLRAARRACGARSIAVRSVPLGPEPATRHIGASVAGWTHAVPLTGVADVAATFHWKGRREVRRAREAGARAVTTRKPDAFLRLYGPSARRHWHRYPDTLIRAVAEAGLARFFEVELGGDRVGAVMALTRGSHWMAWLAAQDDRGRSVAANYLAVAALLEEAAAAGASGVNLGISAGMPGVALFKRRFGAIELPVHECRSEGALAAARGWLRRRVRRIRRPAGRARRRPSG